MSCCKHFPGNGSAAADSHLGLTDITDTWSEEELIPYKQLIAGNNCKMIMSAHVFNPNVVADVVDIIRDLVNEGKVSEKRIRQSYQRIMRAKETL